MEFKSATRHSRTLIGWFPRTTALRPQQSVNHVILVDRDRQMASSRKRSWQACTMLSSGSRVREPPVASTTECWKDYAPPHEALVQPTGVIQGGRQVLTRLPHLCADQDSNSIVRPLRSSSASGRRRRCPAFGHASTR